jgi:hypothetical protein
MEDGPVRFHRVSQLKAPKRGAGRDKLSGWEDGANTRIEGCVNRQTRKRGIGVKGALYTSFETSGRQQKNVLQLASAPIVYPVKIIVEGMTVHGEGTSARGSRWLLRTQDCVCKSHALKSRNIEIRKMQNS